MVSFFGLKFGGGEKKQQKPAEVEESGTKECTYDNRESFIDEKDLMGFDNACGVSYSASVQAMPASESSGQNKVAATLKVSPYGPGAQNMVSSMTDLPSPHKFRDSSYASLRQHSSNPNLAGSFANGSSTKVGLGPPASISSGSRPGTAKKEKPKISPLDTRSISSGTPSTPRSLSSLPNSPPEQYPPNLNIATDATSLTSKLEPEDVPEPLRIRRPMPPRAPGTPSSTRTQSPLRGPSSPQSAHSDSILEDSDLEPPAIPFKSEARPSSRSSNRTAPSGLKAVQNASDLPNNDETFLGQRPPLPRMNTGEPVIQNVRGKWGTVKVRPSPRNGIEMPTPPQRSRTADNRQFDRMYPAPVDFDKRPDTPEWKGPWNTPLAATQRSQTPVSFGSPGSSRSGTPVAAVGAVGRPMPPRNTSAVRKPTLDDYACHHESSDDDDDDDDDDESDDEIPESPDSPLIPLTGPLASPYFPPLEPPPSAHQRQQPAESATQSPLRSASPLELNPAPHDNKAAPHRQPSAFAPPLTTTTTTTTRRTNPPTPDSTEWPLASPISPSDESPRSRPESPILRIQAPLAPPRMPFAQCEPSSPKSPSALSFSRPWTPTNDPVMRRQHHHHHHHVPGTPRRSETAPAPAGAGAGVRPPPPRAATFNTPRRVLSPKAAVIDNNSPGGSGFI